MSQDWFPSTVATGKAFCNREQERTLLRQYIQHGRHTVLIAPRRYGKTSLIHQTLLETKLLHCLIELTMATSTQEANQIIVKQVSALIYSILPHTIKAKQKILNLFRWLNPELILTVGGQKLIFHPEWSSRPPIENITEILKKLDDAATLLKKRVVVVMDEFQQLNEWHDSAIEAAIRHAMQYSRSVSYIFAGSNRHMLLSLFNDKNRPFYNSCELFPLNRISEKNYRPFIQHAAKTKWGKSLSEEVLVTIFSITQLHPAYINKLCGYFWLTEEFPTTEKLKLYWSNFVASQHSKFTEEFLKLSANQKKILIYLANYPSAQPSSHYVCETVGISEASVRQAVNKLLLVDYLYRDQNNIVQILDPALRYFINNANPK